MSYETCGKGVCPNLLTVNALSSYLDLGSSITLRRHSPALVSLSQLVYRQPCIPTAAQSLGGALSLREKEILINYVHGGRPMISAAGKQSLRPTPLDKHSRSIYVSACAGISIPILPRVVTLTPSLRFDLIFFCEFFVVPPPSRTTRGEGVARGAEATGVRNMKRAPCPHPNWLMKV